VLVPRALAQVAAGEVSLLEAEELRSLVDHASAEVRSLLVAACGN
jgi:hypothetical protein